MRLIVGIALLATISLAADYVDRIVAVVDEEPILFSELETAVAEEIYLRRIQGERIPTDSAFLKELSNDVLEQMIDRRVVILRARKDGITVTRTEVDNALDQWIKGLAQNFGSEERFLAELEHQGFTLREFKQIYRKAVEEQLVISNFIRKKFADVSVSESEVIDFFTTKNDSVPDLPEVGEIARIVVLPKLSPEAEKRALSRVDRAVERLKAGERFDLVARDISDDKLTSRSGGLIGRVKLEDLRKELADIAVKLRPGETSEPVRTSYGIEIVKVDSLDGVYYTLRHILVSLEPTHQDSATAYQKINGLRARILRGEPFDSLANLESDDPETRGRGGYIGKVDIGALPPEYRDALEKMEAGQISEVLLTSAGFHILKMISKESRRRPGFEEASDWIRAFLESRKREEAFAKWLEQAREQTYIKKIGL